MPLWNAVSAKGSVANPYLVCWILFLVFLRSGWLIKVMPTLFFFVLIVPFRIRSICPLKITFILKPSHSFHWQRSLQWSRNRTQIILFFSLKSFKKSQFSLMLWYITHCRFEYVSHAKKKSSSLYFASPEWNKNLRKVTSLFFIHDVTLQSKDHSHSGVSMLDEVINYSKEFALFCQFPSLVTTVCNL